MINKLSGTKNDNFNKENGVVYTPEILADYVAQKTLQYFMNDNKNIRNGIRIIDPACGDGVLLKAIWNGLQTNKKPTRGIEDVVCGVDIDKKSIDVCKTKLSSFLSNVSGAEYLKFIKTNALCPFNSKSLASGWGLIMNRFNASDGFDILIANPPWGADISKYKSRLSNTEFRTLNGQFDSYELFIELALLVVKTGGYFSFIVPDSILNHGKSVLRSILLSKTQIKLIARLGEKIFPKINRGCVIIICKNEKPKNDSIVDCFRLRPSQRKMILKGEIKFSDAEKCSLHKVKQNRFTSNKEYMFNIDLRNSEVNVLKKFRTEKCFRDYLTNSRGIELSGRGKVCQCPRCRLWMPFPNSYTKKCPRCDNLFDASESKTQYIISNLKSADSAGLINGYDVKRYQCKPSAWIKTDVSGIDYKDSKLYKGEKLLVRKTGVGITASIDYTNSYTTQVVYIFKLSRKESPLTLEFLLSLINSRAYYFYLMKNYGEIEWRSHPYLTQNQIMNLPVPSIKNDEQISIVKEITRMVRKQLKEGAGVMMASVDARIEYRISKLFNLTKSDYRIIFDAINSAEELLPIKALKNLGINEIFDQLAGVCNGI